MPRIPSDESVQFDAVSHSVYTGRFEDNAVEFGFPSSHAWMSAMWVYLAIQLGRHGVVTSPLSYLICGLSVVAVGMISLSRIMLGVHFSHQVIVGVIFGAAGLACAFYFERTIGDFYTTFYLNQGEHTRILFVVGMCTVLLSISLLVSATDVESSITHEQIDCLIERYKMQDMITAESLLYKLATAETYWASFFTGLLGMAPVFFSFKVHFSPSSSGLEYYVLAVFIMSVIVGTVYHAIGAIVPRSSSFWTVLLCRCFARGALTGASAVGGAQLLAGLKVFDVLHL